MLLEAIYHKPYSEYAFAFDRDSVVFRLRTKKGDVISIILVYHEKFDHTQKGSVKMDKVGSDGMFDYYEARINPGFKRLNYMFFIEGVYNSTWYNTLGFSKGRPEWGLFSYSYICTGDIIRTPAWFENTVLYQIFPDRFNNPKMLGKYTKENIEICKKHDFSHFGGTLKGIEEKLDHLVSLGVNTIYLNPVFKSNSYHRYDTIDYYAVDPTLGSEDELRKLIDLCHNKGLKIIMDAVFNHCSSEFAPFRDVYINGEDSRYKDWFYINSYPLRSYPKPNYECFAFYGGMPKLNTYNEEVKKYLSDVIMYWTKNYSIDGWRFDVADEVDRNFWRHIRERLKAHSKDSILIGEIWDNASTWLNGDQFDTSLNYPLKACINDLFAYKSITVSQFAERVDGYLMSLNPIVVNSMVNIISSHDTPRFLTLCGGNKDRFKLAVVFQFTFPGVPLIYYGDEIGMEGDADPDCRRPMPWDESGWDMELLDLYKFLIGIRKEYKSLTNGTYRNLRVLRSKDILAFRRDSLQESLIVVMNISDEKARGIVNFDCSHKVFTDIISGKDYEIMGKKLDIELNPYEWKIYKVQ